MKRGDQRVNSSSARSGLSRPVVLGVAVVLAAILLLGALGMFSARNDTDPDAEPASYADIASANGLETDPEILNADDDWRAREGIEDAGQTDLSGFARWLDLLDAAQILLWLIWIAAAGIVIFIIYLVVRYGAAIQVGTRADAGEGRTGDVIPGSAAALASEEKTPTLEAVLAIEDESIAIGALQRLVLETALAGMDARLRRSETARAVLRRLPRDWRHYDIVAALVRMAERVRYAGERLDRDGLIAAVDHVRPVIRDARGRA